MSGLDDFSEYEGKGVMPNTVFPKSSDALTPSDKLRLMSLTGQEEDSRAPVDPAFWYGGTNPDPAELKRVEQERRAQARRIAKEAQNRYRESRR